MASPEDGWSDPSEDEQDRPAELSQDAVEKIRQAAHPLALRPFASWFGAPPGEGEAAAAERAAKRRRSDDAGPRSCTHCRCGLVQQPEDAQAPVRLKGSIENTGQAALLYCRGCGHRLLHITAGTFVFFQTADGSTIHGVVRDVCCDKHSTAALHIQQLSSTLPLPPGLLPAYDILHDDGPSGRSLLLTKQHLDVRVLHFAALWARGAAGVLERLSPTLFFQPDGLYDFLAVPKAGCPTFACCGRVGHCGCLNPWAAHGGNPCHDACAHAHDPAVAVPEGNGCRLRGVAYAPGDLAWLVPPAARHRAGQPQGADKQLELGRVEWVGFAVGDDSQELPLSALEGELMLRYERFELSSSVAGFTYRATGQLLECGAKWLRGLADLARHAPGSSVLDGTGGGSGSGVKEGAATAQQQPAATVVAAAGADGGGGHTPSGSDHSANASWGSGDREAGASGGAAGRSDASICTRSPSAGGGGGMQPARAGQQQGGWPVQICDLFCGCGGLSLGLLQALGPGARVKWAVDFFPEALQTYAQCHPGAKTFEEDVCSVLAASKGGKQGYPPVGCPPGVWRVLVGGPPCQGFSKANKGSPEEKARKNVLVVLFLSVLFTLRWPYAIMENVAGLLSAGDTMQRILQAAVSAGYQVKWRLLNTGSYGVAEHRRRLIVMFVRHDVPAPSFPLPYTLFPGAGGYREGSEVCLLEDRQKRALSGVPLVWREHVVVPDAAPLPPLTAREVLWDLPREAVLPGAEARYDAAPGCFYAACMRSRPIGCACCSGGGSGGSGSGCSGSSGGGSGGGGGDLMAAGAPLHNHCTQALGEDTMRRIRRIPKGGQPPPAGRQRWEGACRVRAHPFRPPRAGNFLDLPCKLLDSEMKGLAKNRGDAKLGGIYARLLWSSHFATLTTSLQLYSHTTSTVLHPEEDRPLTVREAARVQGFPDWVEFAGSVGDCYKQVGNAVPPPLAAALGRELARALAAAEQQL